MIDRNMMIEIDHMSAKAAASTLSILEEKGYAGALSSHSWMAEPCMERLYALGGFATQYGHDTTQFVADWRSSKELRDRHGVGYGFGMDMNGFGGTPAPREGAATSAAGPVEYPFTSVDGGSTLDRQVTGDRTWDVNVDGVAHYGQVPDWVEDLRLVGGQELVDDLMEGAESYLSTWEAAAAH